LKPGGYLFVFANSLGLPSPTFSATRTNSATDQADALMAPTSGRIASRSFISSPLQMTMA
jgi:hypothetical protein